MNLILLLALSGFLAVANGQCSDTDITSKTGTISSPLFIKNQRQSCNWNFKFDHLKPQMLILNLTDVQLYYLELETSPWGNNKKCGASLQIREEHLDCKTATTKCYAFYNNNNECLGNDELDSEYKGCSTLIGSGNMDIKFIYHGTYGAFYNFTSKLKIENHPRGFHMTSKVLNCKEEIKTTTVTAPTTRQDTTPVRTTSVSTLDSSTTTDKTTQFSSTFSLTSTILRDDTSIPYLRNNSTVLFTDVSSRAGNATTENNGNKQNSDNKITIIVVCLACLLLLVVVIIAVIFIRKRKQAQKSSNNNIGNDETAINVYSVAYGNVETETPVYETTDVIQTTSQLPQDAEPGNASSENSNQPEVYSTVRRDSQGVNDSRKVTVRYNSQPTQQVSQTDNHEMVDNMLYESR